MTMDPDAIDDVICQILLLDGPDQHLDGHEILAEFAAALQAGRGLEWKLDHPRYQGKP